jgi:hypothetical protein
MKRRRKQHHKAIAEELHAVSHEAYHELHGRYPKAAAAIAAIGDVSSSLVDRSSGLTSPFFKHHRGRR